MQHLKFCFTTIFKSLPSLAYPTCSAVEYILKTVLLLNKIFHAVPRTTSSSQQNKNFDQAQKISAQEINAYYHQTVV